MGDTLLLSMYLWYIGSEPVSLSIEQQREAQRKAAIASTIAKREELMSKGVAEEEAEAQIEAELVEQTKERVIPDPAPWAFPCAVQPLRFHTVAVGTAVSPR